MIVNFGTVRSKTLICDALVLQFAFKQQSNADIFSNSCFIAALYKAASSVEKVAVYLWVYVLSYVQRAVQFLEWSIRWPVTGHCKVIETTRPFGNVSVEVTPIRHFQNSCQQTIPCATFEDIFIKYSHSSTSICGSCTFMIDNSWLGLSSQLTQTGMSL